jgi:multisubunit Na+/H+ antiporter MnhE subunit
VKHVAAWIAWWIALFWLWLLLVGQWNREEVIAAAIAATIAASLAELARTRTGFSARLPAGALSDLPRALGMVVVDFGIVVQALVVGLVGRRAVRGKLYSRELTHPSRAHGTGARAWTTLAASLSPNSFVLDIDPETERVLLHDLVVNRASEEPA